MTTFEFDGLLTGTFAEQRPPDVQAAIEKEIEALDQPPELRPVDNTTATVVFVFDPSQPRDAQGRWGSGRDSLARLADMLELAAPTATSDQHVALMAYTGNMSDLVNPALRSVPGTPELGPDEVEMVKNLSAHLRDAVIPATITVYRGISLPAADKALLEPGAVIHNEAFTSTTLTPPNTPESDESKVAATSTLLMIRVPEGTKGAAYIGAHSSFGHHEREVLFDRDLTLRVIGRETIDWAELGLASARDLIDCEIVPAEAAP